MEIIYKIIQINGDYATAESNSGSLTDIALALLPCDIEEGDTVLFKNFEYTKMA